MSKKIHVALIYGGPSTEYDVSVKSAAAMRKNLSSDKYIVTDVHITREEQWIVDDQPLAIDAALSRVADVDVALLAVHGTFGEDGKLQQVLADHHIIFTGSDAAASALAMDKEQSAIVLEKHGVRMPGTFVSASLEEAQRESKALETPFVVKPIDQGSSVGVSIVHDRNNLAAAVEKGLEHSSTVILQEYIAGREVSCGVLEQGDLQPAALPPTELIPIRADFFDYDAKYTPGATNEVTPPAMSKELIKQIQEIAVKAHAVLGCHGYSRTDMIVAGDTIYTIEVNTLPGMTETSILPQQATAEGMTFPELLDQIIENALQRANKV